MNTLKTVLGYFDFISAPKTIVLPEKYDVTSTIFHEFMHKNLNNRTILGMILTNIIYIKENNLDENEEVLDKISQLIINEIEFVHEGFSTYNEFVYYRNKNRTSSNKEIFEAFFLTLPTEGQYREAFKQAVLIDDILNDNDWNIEFLQTFRIYLLLDISRFVFNVPIFDIYENYSFEIMLDKVKAFLNSNNPRKRWIEILKTLSNNQNKREEFLKNIHNTLLVWEYKQDNDVNDSLEYTGIKYEDNIEKVIANLFPHLSYKSFNEEFKELLQPTESYLDFAKKELSGEFIFIPQVKIIDSYQLNKEQLIHLIQIYNSSTEIGCHLKLFINNSNQIREIDWSHIGKTLYIQPNETVILHHHAEFTQTNNGRRWNYNDFANLIYIGNEDLVDIVKSVKTDDINICIDYALDESNNNIILKELANLKFPIYFFPEPRGSLDSLIKIASESFITGTDFDIFFNQTSPGFAVNQSLISIWLIPEVESKNVSFLTFCDNIFLLRLLDLPEKGVSLPFRFLSIEACDATTIKFGTSNQFKMKTERFWELGGDNGKKLLAPHNMEPISGHHLDFGF